MPPTVGSNHPSEQFDYTMQASLNLFCLIVRQSKHIDTYHRLPLHKIDWMIEPELQKRRNLLNTLAPLN